MALTDIDPVKIVDGLTHPGTGTFQNRNKVRTELRWKGRVVGWVDLEGLLSAEDRSEPVDVLNGIAYDEQTDRLFVTGKLWPKLFEIEVISPE